MSTHNYTRKSVDGNWANPWMGDPDLTDRVKTALPGKTFTIRCHGASLSIVFDDTLTAGEVITLDAEYVAWTPVEPVPVPPQSPQQNFQATAPPTGTDDEDAGYSIGSLWVDTTNDKAYICLDATAASAIWKDTTTVAGVLGTWTGPWVTSTVYAVDDASENQGSSYICISAHTAGATDEPGVGASWQTFWEVVAAAGTTVPPAEVSSTVLASTLGSEYILLPSMTMTPAAGTYKFSFSGSGAVVDNTQLAWIALFKDGTLVQHTERQIGIGGTHDHAPLSLPLSTQAVLTVNGSEAVETRYKSSDGEVFTVHDRSLIRGT
jgi:hypothetical protein